MTDQWGVGDKADAEVFRTARVGKTPVGLLFGEHPHSRSDNKVYARWPSGRVEPFDGHWIKTRVEVEEQNYLKESELSGDEVRKGGSCKIFLNDQIVYEFFIRDAQRGLIRAHALIDQLKEHPAIDQLLDESVAEGDRLRGRKIYYRDTPAVCGYSMPDQGCLIVEAEVGHSFPIAPWDQYSDPSDRQSEKEDILSKSIWWWRD